MLRSFFSSLSLLVVGACIAPAESATRVQPWDADLVTLSGVVPGATGLALLADTTAADARTELALGDLSTLDGCECVLLTTSGTDTLPAWTDIVSLDLIGGGGGGGGGRSHTGGAYRPGGGGGAGGGRWIGWLSFSDIATYSPSYTI